MNEETSLNTDLEEFQNGSSPENESHDKSVNGLYEWVEAAVFSLSLVVLVFSILFRIVGVDGDSMNNTLINRDRLIITNLNYTPQRGDIIIINRYNSREQFAAFSQDPTNLEPLVKRVIAVGGDTLQIKESTNEVIVNGVVQNEPFIKGKTYPVNPELEKPVEVKKGYVFVMGDNRENSMDSRYFGFIKESDIMGKAIFRFLPFDKAGKLY